MLFRSQVNVEWDFQDKQLISRKILITKPELNGKTLAQLKIRNDFGASITRVNRSGVDLVATPHLQLQMGDRVKIVGSELAVAHAEKILGNSTFYQYNHKSSALCVDFSVFSRQSCVPSTRTCCLTVFSKPLFSYVACTYQVYLQAGHNVQK